MKSFTTLLITLTGLLISSMVFAAAEKVYKWVDAQGQTHYSQRPPQSIQTEVIKPATGHSDPVKYETAPAVGSNLDVQPAPAPVKEKDKARCESARKAAETLKTFARVRIKDSGSGEYRYLTPAEHQDKVAEADKAIHESCD